MSGSASDHERPALRPVYRRPPPDRPKSRPPSVWVIALILVTFALLGSYLGTTALIDAVDHGADEEVVVAFGLGVLLSVALLVMGSALFAGARWGRTGALALCLLNIGLAAVGGVTDRLNSGQLWFALAGNLVLIFVLLGPQVYAWTGGDRPTST